MESLRQSSSSIYKEFERNGSFVIRRARNPFSDMGLDQRHEQLNKDVKCLQKTRESIFGNEYQCLWFFAHHGTNPEFSLSICYQG